LAKRTTLCILLEEYDTGVQPQGLRQRVDDADLLVRRHLGEIPLALMQEPGGRWSAERSATFLMMQINR